MARIVVFILETGVIGRQRTGNIDIAIIQISLRSFLSLSFDLK